MSQIEDTQAQLDHYVYHSIQTIQTSQQIKTLDQPSPAVAELGLAQPQLVFISNQSLHL